MVKLPPLFADSNAFLDIENAIPSMSKVDCPGAEATEPIPIPIRHRSGLRVKRMNATIRGHADRLRTSP